MTITLQPTHAAGKGGQHAYLRQTHQRRRTFPSVPTPADNLSAVAASAFAKAIIATICRTAHSASLNVAARMFAGETTHSGRHLAPTSRRARQPNTTWAFAPDSAAARRQSAQYGKCNAHHGGQADRFLGCGLERISVDTRKNGSTALAHQRPGELQYEQVHRVGKVNAPNCSALTLRATKTPRRSC